MKIIILAFFTLFSCYIFSQKNDNMKGQLPYCCWANICLNKTYIPVETDTCLLIVSTRNYNETKHEFVDFDYDTTGTLKYFAVYFNGNNWTAVPYKSLSELLDLKSSFKDLVVFVEGLGRTFTSGVDRGAKLMRNYPVDVIFFDWPTGRPYMHLVKNIKVTSSLAPAVAKRYAEFLKDLQTYKTNDTNKFKTVTLFFHSMGNLLLMHNLKNDAFNSIMPSMVNSVIMNASCVNHTNHKAWLDKLTFADNIYITINDKDKTLRAANVIFGDHQLGEKAGPVFCEKANYINFSKVLNREHNYYVMRPVLKEKPFLKKFYGDIFKGKIPEKSYPASLLKKKKNLN